MSEKKTARRSVAIALGIVCIILLAGIGGAMAYYTMTINDKNTKYDALTNYKNQLETWLAGNITDLQNQVNDLNDTLNLGKSTVWIQNATAWPEGGYQFSASYCGYIKVDLISSIYGPIPAIPITVRVMYATLGIAYDDSQTILTAGSAFFPILPCNNTVVKISYLPSFDSVTITYY
jgi:predicted PurR-regulated permease PerM